MRITFPFFLIPSLSHSLTLSFLYSIILSFLYSFIPYSPIDPSSTPSL